MTDLTDELNFEPDELDYGENDADDGDELNKNEKEDDGELSDTSDDGEIKSEPEDGEIDESDSSHDFEETPVTPSLFPGIKAKRPAPPPKEELTPQQQARSTIPCRYFKQGYCQFGTKCHFQHDRPNMVNINPEKEPEIDKGKYKLFPSDEKDGQVGRRPINNINFPSRPAIPPRIGGPSETAWEKGIKNAQDKIRKQKRLKDVLEPNDARKKITGVVAELKPSGPVRVVATSSRPSPRPVVRPAPAPKLAPARKRQRGSGGAVLRREPSHSPDERKSRSHSRKKDDRWDRETNWKNEQKKARANKTETESSTSSSTSSSDSDSTSESSGRATPKGYRSTRNGNKSTSDDEDYKREKRLQDKAKRVSAKYKSSSAKKFRSRSTSNRRTKPSRSRRKSRETSSSSSSSSSDSDSSSDDSQPDERKLQKRLQQVEAALKAKKANNRRK